MIKNITKLFFLMGLTGFQGFENNNHENNSVVVVNEMQIEYTTQLLTQEQMQTAFNKHYNQLIGALDTKCHQDFTDTFEIYDPEIQEKYDFNNPLILGNIYTSFAMNLFKASLGGSLENIKNMNSNIHELYNNAVKQSSPKLIRTIKVKGDSYDITFEPSKFFELIVTGFLKKKLDVFCGKAKSDEDFDDWYSCLFFRHSFVIYQEIFDYLVEFQPITV
jgi:hypothetical protein